MIKEAEYEPEIIEGGGGVRRDQDPDQGRFKYNENTESCKGKDETMTYNLEREIIIMVDV